MEKKTNPLRTENPAIVCIVGKSGSGKTTLLEKLIPELTGMGLKVGTIKHDVHGFEIDHPGKDSWRHKQAGSAITIISSPQRIGVVMDVEHDHTLDELASFFSGVDIILTEGLDRVESMPGFVGSSVNPKDALIVILGFEEKRSREVFHTVNPELTYAVNGFPS